MYKRQVLFSQIEGRRHVGRPKARWFVAVARDADNLLKIKRWTSITKDREKWRRMIMEANVRLPTVTPWKKKKNCFYYPSVEIVLISSKKTSLVLCTVIMFCYFFVLRLYKPNRGASPVVCVCFL